MEVYLVGSLCPQAGVRASGVVKLEVTPDLASGFADRLVGMQVDVLVFERTPEALDEDVVGPATLAIHADLDAFFFEPSGEGFAGELTALIGVEDLGLAVLVILAFWFGPSTAVKFGPLGRHWLGFMDGATEA